MKSNILPALGGVRRKFWDGCTAALSHLPKTVLKERKQTNKQNPKPQFRIAPTHAHGLAHLSCATLPCLLQDALLLAPKL